MIFTLEALRAKHGDSLVLHFGDTDAPRFIVIDGGPNGVCNDAFRPRLDQLAASWPNEDGKLPVEILMVSHMDDDHIRGVLDFSDDLIASRAVAPSPVEVATLWHNSFSDVLSEDDTAVVVRAVRAAPAQVASAAGPLQSWSGNAQAVVASVPQARRLRDNAVALGWAPNVPFDGLVVAPDSGGRTLRYGDLRLTVVGPLQREVDALAADWAKNVRRLREARDAKEASVAATTIDDSVYNLSSIVCLAELDGKRMLLTGDALGSKVLEGLERARAMPVGGTIEVDVLKLPHHGSSRNVDDEFFRRIQARHYVASGDGKYDNPEAETLEMIARTRAEGPQRDEFTIHLTYDRFSGGLESRIAAFLARKQREGRRYSVLRRSDPDRSLRVDLLDPVSY